MSSLFIRATTLARRNSSKGIKVVAAAGGAAREPECRQVESRVGRPDFRRAAPADIFPSFSGAAAGGTLARPPLGAKLPPAKLNYYIIMWR
jgi:hypothetical protein